MIKLSSFFKTVVIGCTMIMMGYLQIFPITNIGNFKFICQIIVALIGMLMAFIVLILLFKNTGDNYSSPDYRYEYKLLNFYIVPYIIILIIEILNTQLLYHYNLSVMINSLLPYLYIFWAYPLIYIFDNEKSIYPLLKTICKLAILMIVIKFIGWFFYNYKGMNLFQNLVLETTDWIRNGKQRIDVTPLFGITFVYYFYRFLITNKRRFINLMIIVALIGYLILVTQVRYQTIVVVLTGLIMIYFIPEKNGYGRLGKLIVTFLLLLGMITGGIAAIIELFSVNGINGASTAVRFEGIQHFLNIMKNTNHYLIGLGMMSQWNGVSEQLLYRNQWSYYYLSDLGIIGEFIIFGVLGIIVYGLMFYFFIKTDMKLKDRWQRVALTGLLAYLIMSSLSLNVFDLSRSFDVPFYFAIFSYMNSMDKQQGIISKNEE